MVPNLIILILGLTAFYLTPTAAQFSQRATLFSDKKSTGTSVNLIQTYSPNLTSYNFDNQAQSACVTGMWLFYNDQTFNSANAPMEFIFGSSNFCTNFRNLAGKVSSARFAGSPSDYRIDTLTLFNGTYFQGVEQYTESDLPNLHLGEVSSLILTGTSPWTLYDQENYQGAAICVQLPNSKNFTPALISASVSIGVSRGEVRSVRKGCFGRIILADKLAKGLVNLSK